jgi:hypothetical protein
MQITKKERGGFTLYNFKSRGLFYEVVTTDFKIFDVFSTCGRMGNKPPERFESLAELGRGNATLKKLSQHIAREAA